MSKFDTKFDISILGKRGFVWYGKYPIAFTPGDGTMNLLLPFHALKEFPYYSASYGGFCKIDAPLGVDMLAVLAHWANCCFGRPIDDETLAHAKQVEARWFSPAFAPLEEGGVPPKDSSTTIEEFNNIIRGMSLTVRGDTVEVRRKFDIDNMKRELTKQTRTDFVEEFNRSPEQIRWYMEDTKQEKVFFIRLLSTPRNIIAPYSAHSTYSGHMKFCRYKYERAFYTPRYTYCPCVVTQNCYLVQYGTLDKIEKQWVGPKDYCWLFPGRHNNNAICVGERDAEAYNRRGFDPDEGEPYKSLFEHLDALAMITAPVVTPEEALNVMLINAAMQDVADPETRVTRYPMPLKEILWEGKDAKQALKDLEAFDPKLVHYSGYYGREISMKRTLNGAVEFRQSDREGGAVLSSLWRDSVQKL